MSKVSDPNAKSGNGFIWGVGVLLVTGWWDDSVTWLQVQLADYWEVPV